MRAAHHTPGRPGHLALGTGWGPPTTRRVHSAARAPHGSQGPRGSWLRPGHFLCQQPGHRQVIALPGAPARLCAAAPLPRPGRPGPPPPPPGRCQAGQLRAQPGRPRRGGSPRRCPPPGGDANFAAAGQDPTFPAGRRGSVPRQPDVPTLGLPTAGSHSKSRPQKSCATQQAT